MPTRPSWALLPRCLPFVAPARARRRGGPIGEESGKRSGVGRAAAVDDRAVPCEPVASGCGKVDDARDAAGRVETHARTLFAAMLAGDALRTTLAGLRRILKIAPMNTVVPRRRIADAVTHRKGYIFE